MVADHASAAEAGMAKSLETNDLEQQLRYELSNIRIAFPAKTPRRPAKPSSKSAGPSSPASEPRGRDAQASPVDKI